MNRDRFYLEAALFADPSDHVGWAALADWYEENDQLAQAELLRLQIWLTDHLDHPDRLAKERRQCQLIANKVEPACVFYDIPLRKSLSIRFSLIPPGQFYMGNDVTNSARGEEGPRHKVLLTRPFLIAITPITQSQWFAVMRNRPSMQRGPKRPVDSVHWEDCQNFCTTLTERIGHKVRLPTEAEWEYACRAGISADYYSGFTMEDLERVAWFQHLATTNVGQHQPNGWGLYDMLGNVWEWTADAYRNYPSRATPRRNPRFNRRSSYRAARGGGFSNPAACCRSSTRICFAAAGRNHFIGFRPVLDWPVPVPTSG
jgi:uncharacterized protein (TIGR02996 family)